MVWNMAFIFHVIYGMSSFPFNIFQRGWNHQPVYNNNNNNIMGLNVDVLFIGNHFGFIMVCYSLEIIMYIDVIKLGISYCLLFGQILSCFFWYVWHVETELLLETAIFWASGMVTGQCPGHRPPWVLSAQLRIRHLCCLVALAFFGGDFS